MSQNQSRRVELQISTEAAIIAMGVSGVTTFTTEPWRDPSVRRIGAFCSHRMWELPPEYKVNLTS